MMEIAVQDGVVVVVVVGDCLVKGAEDECKVALLHCTSRAMAVKMALAPPKECPVVMRRVINDDDGLDNDDDNDACCCCCAAKSACTRVDRLS